jgi:hypothetical protein
MIWKRKQSEQAPPAKASYELVLSPAEKASRSAAAAWPTGLAHLWLRRAPNAVVVPAYPDKKHAKPCGSNE